MGTRMNFTNPLSSGRAGWRQGSGEHACSWYYAPAGRHAAVTRARGMFLPEVARANGRGVRNLGERRTLAEAQVAVEHELVRLLMPVPRAA